MGIGREIVEVLQRNIDWLTVSELKEELNNKYSSKQVGTEIRRIKEWSILGQKWIMKKQKTVQNRKKNGKLGKERLLYSYKMKNEAKNSHIEVLLSLTRGPAFNHHNQKVEARRRIVKNTKLTVNKLTTTLINNPVISSEVKNNASVAFRRVNKVTNLKTSDCY